MKEKPIVIAHIVGKWLGGGVESVIMNYYRNIDRSKVQFDFICDEDSTDIPYDEINRLGGNVILVPPYQKVFKYIKALKKIFKENDYRIVHSHLNALSVFPLYAAKHSNVPIRIAHSHSTTNKRERKKNLLKQLLRPFSRRYATNYFCCSELAGRWLFGNKCYDAGNVTVINNAIELEKFAYNESIRDKKRLELGISSDDIVVGHIGRFVDQKNHDFLLDIFKKLHDDNKNYKLVLIGKGPNEVSIINKINSLGITDSVLLLGQRNDVSDLYQAMDIFVFPSLYEGLGMVLIEAQVSGLFCFASTEVPDIASVTSQIKYIGLDKTDVEWANEIRKIKSNRGNYIEEISNNGYNIKIEAQKLEDLYINMISGDKYE